MEVLHHDDRLARLAGYCLLVLLGGQVAKGGPALKSPPARQLSPSKRLDFFPSRRSSRRCRRAKAGRAKGGRSPGRCCANRRQHPRPRLHGPGGAHAPAEGRGGGDPDSGVPRDDRHLSPRAARTVRPRSPPAICVYSPSTPRRCDGRRRRPWPRSRASRGSTTCFPIRTSRFTGGRSRSATTPRSRRNSRSVTGTTCRRMSARSASDPRRWLDVINFRSDYFPDGWRQVHKIIKELDPSFKTVLTHDSHNTFGAGYGSHCGAGDRRRLSLGRRLRRHVRVRHLSLHDVRLPLRRAVATPKPRISQTHYCFAQMRNLTRAYGKELGFWVGTYNPAWFKDFMGPDLQATYWSEREMSATAVAQGADFLLTGLRNPRRRPAIGNRSARGSA